MQYTYTGDEQIVISAKDLVILKAAVDYGIQATSKIEYPEVFIYVNSETGAKVNKPKKEDLISGKFVQTIDPEATFSPANIRVSYDGRKLQSEMLIAQRLLEELHQANIASGIAKLVEPADAISQ